MKIVTGVGESAHVTPEEFRMIFEGTFGGSAYILDTGEKMEPELVSNNLLKIKSGIMCDDEGNISSVDIYDEVELKNGTQGMKRIDLIVNRYTKNDETKIEENKWVCITGTPAASDPVAPAHTVGSLREGDLVKDIPFIKVYFDGLNITQIEKLVNVTKNIKDLTAENEDRKAEIAQLNGNMLQITECKADEFIIPAYEEAVLYLYPDIPSDCEVVSVIPRMTGVKGVFFEGFIVSNKRTITAWVYNVASIEQKSMFYCNVLYKKISE